MFYVEMLRTRITLMWSLIGLCVLCIVTVLLGAFMPGMRYDPSQQPMAFVIVAWVATLVTAIVASFLGSSLATENCRHLELAWTKPISRSTRALGVFTIDIVALVAIFGMTFAAAYLAASFLDGHIIRVAFDQSMLPKMARFLLFPLAWFGLSQGLTAGLHGKTAGMTIGLTWPIAEGLSVLAAAPFAAPLHNALAVVNIVNPISYFPFWTFDESVHHGLRPVFGFGLTIDVLALAAIAIIGLVIATFSWRRLEA